MASPPDTLRNSKRTRTHGLYVNPLASVALVTAAASFQVAPQPYRYRVELPDPAAETFHVTFEIILPQAKADTLVFSMPIWAPGGYQLVHYGRWVRNLRAVGPGGKQLRVLSEAAGDYATEGAAGDSWKIVTEGAGRIVIRYEVDDIEVGEATGLWFELSDLRPDEAFFNGTAVFGYLQGGKDAPYEVCYRVPAGWTLMTPLEPTSPECFSASSYDALVDAPVFMGRDLQVRELQVPAPGTDGARRIRLAVSPVGRYESDSLLGVIRDVVRAGIDFFGDAPFHEYWFLVEFAGASDSVALARYGDSFGALEHANSSVYLLPQVPPQAVRGIFFFPQVFAHEFFHLWSPKRIHSDRLGPFEYQAPVETETLWFAEGVTDYYAYVWLARYGIVDRWRVFKELGELVERLRFTPHAYAEPITALSKRLPLSENVDEILPLYYKGTLLGFMLDVHLRRSSENKVSLDSVMRSLNRRYGQTGRGFPDDSLVSIVEGITGVPLAEFATQYLRGRQPYPIEEIFAAAGLKLEHDTVRQPMLGVRFSIDDAGRLFIAEVTGPAGLAQLGVQARDIITSWDGAPLSIETAREVFEAFGKTYDPERVYSLTLIRDGKSLELQGRIPYSRSLDLVVSPDPRASALATAIREGIFGPGASARQ